MKTIRMPALVALTVSFVAIGAAQAMDHPKKTEHPVKSEHPATAEHPAAGEHPSGGNDLVAVASGSDDLTSFVAAVKAAGLVEKLQEKGPFTLFVPSDAAFAKLPEGALEHLLEPANKAALAGILASHVVPGMILAADVKTMKAANVNGRDLAIEVKDGVVTVDGARVIRTDLKAGNGVIHVIDGVIMPGEAHEHPASDKPKDHPAH
ncbi:MAG: fasciclin domain-containing protein [Candidatus Krumholzibacteriia bacterium]